MYQYNTVEFLNVSLNALKKVSKIIGNSVGVEVKLVKCNSPSFPLQKKGGGWHSNQISIISIFILDTSSFPCWWLQYCYINICRRGGAWYRWRRFDCMFWCFKFPHKTCTEDGENWKKEKRKNNYSCGWRKRGSCKHCFFIIFVWFYLFQVLQSPNHVAFFEILSSKLFTSKTKVLLY